MSNGKMEVIENSEPSFCHKYQTENAENGKKIAEASLPQSVNDNP
jgi:hypothetical protein